MKQSMELSFESTGNAEWSSYIHFDFVGD